MGMQLKKSYQEKALAALNRLGKSQVALGVDCGGLAPSTINSFFSCKGIRSDNFNLICEKLNLDPKDVAEGVGEVAGSKGISHTQEKFARDRIRDNESLIRIVAPSGFGKSTLIGRLLAYTESLGHQNIHANLDDIINNSKLDELEIFLKNFVYNLESSTGATLEDEYNRRVEQFGCTNAFLWYLKGLQSQSCILNLVISNLDVLLNYPEIGKSFFSLLRSINEKTKVDKNWKNFRLILAHSTPLIENLLPMDINSSPFNVGTTIELGEFSTQKSKELFYKHDLLLEEWQVSRVQKWIGGIPLLLILTIDKMKLLGIQPVMDVIAADDRDKILAIYANHLTSISRCLEVEGLFPTMVSVAQSSEPITADLLKRCRLHRRGTIVFADRDAIEPRCRLYREYFNSIDETR
jgi:protein SERAC1